MLGAVWWTLFGLPSTCLISSRKAGRVLPPGASLWTIGFRELANDVTKARQLPHSCRFLFAHMLYSGGLSGVVAVMPLFAFKELQMEQSMLVVMIIEFQTFSLLGACFCGMLAKRGVNTRILLFVSVAVAMAVTFLCFFVLRTQAALIVVVVPMALAMGSIYALGRAIFARRMIPPGCEAEFFGVYGVFGKAWGPVAVGIFTLFNEAFDSLRSGMIPLGCFFGMSLCILQFTDFEQALKDTQAFTESEGASADTSASSTDVEITDI